MIVAAASLTIAVACIFLNRWYENAFPKIILKEYERGIRFVKGKLDGIQEPGMSRYRRATTEIIPVDLREQMINVAGQEVLSSDALGFKISIQADYRLTDPVKSVTVVSSFYASLYADIQAAARVVLESMTSDEILANRAVIGARIESEVRQSSVRYGVELVSLKVRDYMLPGNLKQIFAKVAEARQEGLAALERARGESAALRNLANAARAMENNPNLSYLRLLQTIEKNGGSSMFVLPPALGDLMRPSSVKTDNKKGNEPTG
jgi:regulator of protease activity HflC (stomatin/prohibitin superfamily)